MVRGIPEVLPDLDERRAVRGAPFVVPTAVRGETEREPGTGDWQDQCMDLDPERTVVLALHWQVNVVRPEGFFGPMLAGPVAASGVVGRARSFHQAARDRGARLVFTRFTVPVGEGQLVRNTAFMAAVADAQESFRPDAPGAAVVADAGHDPDRDEVSDNQRLSGLAASDLPDGGGHEPDRGADGPARHRPGVLRGRRQRLRRRGGRRRARGLAGQPRARHGRLPPGRGGHPGPGGASGVSVLVRRARASDVRQIRALVAPLAAARVLVAKEAVSYYEALQEFRVAEVDGELAGCGALHVMWEDLAEVRTLAVADRYRGRGVGSALLTALVDDARELGVQRLFCLTFEVGFFSSHGFSPIDGTPVPTEVYTELLRSHDDGVAEFLDLARVKPNTLGNTRMLRTLQ
jgi:amino-acid N-acetyltransferase